MFYPEIDNHVETINRVHGLLTRLEIEFKLEYNAPREIRFKVICKEDSTRHLYVVCKYEDRPSGTYLVHYSIYADFCKGRYESGPCVNGRVTITELIQDLEDAINRKAEDWKV